MLLTALVPCSADAAASARTGDNVEAAFLKLAAAAMGEDWCADDAGVPVGGVEAGGDKKGGCC